MEGQSQRREGCKDVGGIASRGTRVGKKRRLYNGQATQKIKQKYKNKVGDGQVSHTLSGRSYCSWHGLKMQRREGGKEPWKKKK